MPSLSRAVLPACAAGLALLLCGCGPEEPVAAPVPAPPPTDTVTVTRIVDGDTFDVADGRTVRVLGIDSCEAGTSAGRAATDVATGLLLGKPVTLTAEQGVDRDPYGRDLRYVAMSDGQDFGSVMVPATHTGVYEGGDANPQAVAALRTLDAGGRICDEPAPATSSSAPPPVAQDDDNDRPYVPAPAPNRDDDANSGSNSSGNGNGGSDDSGADNGDSGGSGDSGTGTKPRTGNSGHPCGPGERDGDDDGYCGEK